MDVIGFSATGTWYVGTSTGASFTSSVWATWSAASNWSLVQVGDDDTLDDGPDDAEDIAQVA